MPRKFDSHYRMKDRRDLLGETFFNPVFRDLDARVAALEGIGKDWRDAVQEVSAEGLARINSSIKPAYDRIGYYQQAGFLSSALEGDVTWAEGSQTVVLSEGVSRDLFRPSPWLTIVRTGAYGDYLIGRPDPEATPPYNPETGELQLDISAVSGSPVGGTANDCEVWATPGMVQTLDVYRQEGKTLRDAARDARDNAITAKTDAEASEAAAAQSAADAASSENAAAVSETNAAGSEAAAAQSAADAALGPVMSVCGYTGDVLISKYDIGLSNVSNDAQLKKGSNLSDLSPFEARKNLGLGTQATKDQHVAGSSQNANDGDVTYIV